MLETNEFRQMVDYVKNYIELRDPIGTSLAPRFRFRRRFEHCMRCAVWARRIAPEEHADIEITVISALFHDISKSEQTENRTHGEIGAEVCNEYLTSTGYDINRKDRIVQIVRNHSNHAAMKNASLEARVVSDTDVLDEKGALTVLWDSMACAEEDSPSYEKVYERLSAQYTRLKSGPESFLHTRTAQKILSERLLFLENFLKNLAYELGYTDSLP